MPVGHAETGDERKAAAGLLPGMVGNIRAPASFDAFRHPNRVAQPVGTDTRSRTHAGGYGMLWLTALTFSLMKEVRAADPNVTFLDDGNITYKDLEHGVFELVTKEAIPRHILVEDPGQTIVLRPVGSSMSVNQVTNSPARMAELQAAQQDALAVSERGVGSTGSSTPPGIESLPIQPINFILNGSSIPTQEALPQPSVLFVSVPENIVGRIPPPPPLPPTLNAIAGPAETDTVAFDLFTATSGAFTASSSDGAPLTFGISGGTAGTTVVDGAPYDVSEAGPYGTLFVDSATGAYTFVPDNDAINALTEPTTTSFTITVSDGALSAAQEFTIAIHGTNDAATISGNTSGEAVEAGDVSNAAALRALTATGTLTAADVDNTPNTFTAVTSPTPSTGGYGTFMITAAGVWAYTVDESNAKVQALNVGDTLTDSFTVTSVDGTPQVVTITIRGANDAAIIAGATTGSVTEEGIDQCGDPTATGKLTADDVDNTPNAFTAVSCPTESDGGYGTFTMTAGGVWTYKLDDSNCTVQALEDGDTLTDTFTVTSIDGTEQVVTITINGANDADPNDFDYLATGRCVESHGPYIFGTRGDDTITNCGHYGRVVFTGAGDDTIYATDSCDVVYGGSGNDRIKGNDGDDTIYGGSGRDTIDGGYGCDTIIGGYGADHLTGGKGNDSFVFLSAADSRAGRFDVISDFKSGSDRIDVTALGALAFMALTSSSTSVPAHTIAWLYDSSANQTIVYVNSTNQTHEIGDSALLEIHLEGFVTVQACDFVPEPAEASAVVAIEQISPEVLSAATDDTAVVTLTTAEASFDSTGSEHPRHADESWTVRTAEHSEAPTHSPEDAGDVTVITSTGEQPVELHRGDHVTTSTELKLLDSAPTPYATVYHAVITALNDDRGALRRTDHGRTSDNDGDSARSHNDGQSNFSASFENWRSNDGHRWWDDHGRSKAVDHDHNHGGRHSHSDDGTPAPSIAQGLFGAAAADAPWLGQSFHFNGRNFDSGPSAPADVNHNTVPTGHRDMAAEINGFDQNSHGHHAPDDFSFMSDHARHGGGHSHHDLVV